MRHRDWGGAAVVVVAGIVVIAASQVLSEGRQGTDETARQAVESGAPGYTPWAQPVRVNTAAQERRLFILQGVIGVATLALATWALRRRPGADAPE